MMKLRISRRFLPIITIVVAMVVSALIAICFFAVYGGARDYGGKETIKSGANDGVSQPGLFDERWNAASNGDTIKLESDSAANVDLSIKGGKTITVDLNGHILYINNGGFSVFNGTLNIIDSDPTAKNTYNGKEYEGGLLVNEVPSAIQFADNDVSVGGILTVGNDVAGEGTGSGYCNFTGGTMTGVGSTYMYVVTVIDGNTLPDGNNNKAANFVMSGTASIRDNTAMAVGARRYGKFEMNGGTISGNKNPTGNTTRYGVVSGSGNAQVFLNNGTIKENEGNVDMAGTSWLALGGELSIVLNNTTVRDRVGGGVHIEENAYVSLSGGPIVSGNTCLLNNGGTYNRIISNYINNSNNPNFGKRLCIWAPLTDRCNIGLTNLDANPDNVVFAQINSGVTIPYNPQRYFVADGSTYGLDRNGNHFIYTSNTALSVAYVEKNDKSASTPANSSFWKAWEQAKLLTPSTIVLMRDVTPTTTDNFIIANGEDITLDLNGHTVEIYNQNVCFNIQSGGKLTVKDSATGTVHFYTVDSDGLYILDQSAFDDPNKEVIYGGAITGARDVGAISVASNGHFVFNGGNIVGNKAVSGAGAVLSASAKMTMNDGCFIGNVAAGNARYGGWGGAIASGAGSVIDINGGKMLNNKALVKMNGTDEITSWGGAIYTESVPANGKICNLSVDNCEISGNFAMWGGAICLQSGGDISLTNSVFSNNTAWKGGALHFAGAQVYQAQITVTDCKITDNKAITGVADPKNPDRDYMGDGGGIYLPKYVDMTLSGGEISGNTATSKAGGVYIMTCNVVIEDTKIIGNSSDDEAGGITLRGGSTLTMNGTVADNHAKGDGGGMYCFNSDVKIERGIIENNKADYNGGAIYMGAGAGQGAAKILDISGGKIAGNVAMCASGIYVGDADNNVEIQLSGAPVIYGNTKTDGVGRNIRLPSGKYLQITGEIKSGAKVGLVCPNVGGTPLAREFTRGFDTHNPGDDPSKYFVSDADIYTVIPKLSVNKEAFLGVGISKAEITDKMNGKYSAFDVLDYTAVVTLTDGTSPSASAVELSVSYKDGRDKFYAGDTSATVVVTYKGNSAGTDYTLTEEIDCPVTVSKKKIDLSDNSKYTFDWRLDKYGALHGGNVYSYEVNGKTEYYYSEQEDLGEATVIPDCSIVRYRNKMLKIVLDCGESLPVLADIAYSGVYEQSAIGSYSATAVITLKDKVNYVFAVQAGSELVLSENDTVAKLDHDWYLVHISNGLKTQSQGANYGDDFVISGWTFGDDVEISAPRLEHGDGDDATAVFAESDQRVAFELWTNDKTKRFGGEFYRYDFGDYINKTMPAGRYVLKVKAASASIPDTDHTHWWDGATHGKDDGGLVYDAFECEYAFTVGKATMTGLSGDLPSGEQISEEYDGKLKLGTVNATATLLYTNAADRLGIWKTSGFGEYYSDKLTVRYGVTKSGSGNFNGEFYTEDELKQLPVDDQPLNADRYTVYYILTAPNYNDYPDGNIPFYTVDIAKAQYDLADLGISFKNKTLPYTGNIIAIEIDGKSKLPEGVTVSYLDNENIERGTHTVTAVFTHNNPNYDDISSLTATLTIDFGKYNITKSTFKDTTVTYDGQPHSIVRNGSLPAAVSISYEGNGETEVGNYTVTARFTNTDPNFATPDPWTATLNITKASYDMSGITLLPQTFTYDGNAKSLAISGTLPNGVQVSYTGNGQIEVGEYDIYAVFTGDAHNYEAITNLTAKLNITKASYDMSGITLLPQTFTYDGNAKSLAISGTLPNGVQVSYTGNGQTDVGEYDVNALFTGDAHNYEAITNLTAKLNITKARYDMSGITLLPQTFTYDGNAKSLAISGTLPNGVQVSYTGNGQTDVGEYDVYAVFTGDARNYEAIPSLRATLTINARPTGPVDPSDPNDPTNPSDPSGPNTPVDPSDPSESVKPNNPSVNGNDTNAASSGNDWWVWALVNAVVLAAIGISVFVARELTYGKLRRKREEEKKVNEEFHRPE